MRRKDGQPRKDCKIRHCWREMLSKYRDGMTIRQLADEYGIHHSNISRFFNMRHLILRTHTQAGILSVSCGRAAIRYGREAPGWRGGKTMHSCGYVMVKLQSHPRASHAGYINEAVLVLEAKLGRPLLPTEIAHHINGHKTDNRADNLKCMTISEHGRLHGKEGAMKRWGVKSKPHT